MDVGSERTEICLEADLSGYGPEVILLHAGGESRQVWRPIARNLLKKGFASVAPDQRGHGRSGGSRDASIDAFASDLRALIGAVGGCPVVVGASLGGFAAMLALGADAWQSRAAGLVLVDVVPDPDPLKVRAYLDQPQRRMADLPLVTEILGRPGDFREAVRRLSLPLMLVRGERSTVGEDDVERLRGLAPHLQVATVADAGHLVARDAPADLSAVLLSFLSDPVVARRHSGGRGIRTMQLGVSG